MILRHQKCSSTQSVMDGFFVEHRASAESGRSLVDCTTVKIPRIYAGRITTKQVVTHYRTPGLPVVLAGCLETEHSRGTLHFLEQNLGDVVVSARFHGQEHYTQEKQTWTSTGSSVTTRLHIAGGLQAIAIQRRARQRCERYCSGYSRIGG